MVTVLLGALLAEIVVAAPMVYIPLGLGNQVIAIDGATDAIKASYKGVENSHGIVATPDGEYLVAGSLKQDEPKTGSEQATSNSKLYLIHPQHGHVMSTIPVDGWTHHQAITPDGKYVLSTHGSRGYVSVVDLETNQVSQVIETGISPNYTIVSADGKTAFVSNTGSNTISELNIDSWTVTRTLEGGPGPEHLVFSGDEQTIYVTNPRAGLVSSISRRSGKVENSYEIGKAVHGLDVGDDGNTLYVSSKKDNKLVAIDGKTGTRKELELSPSPYQSAFSPAVTPIPAICG